MRTPREAALRTRDAAAHDRCAHRNSSRTPRFRRPEIRTGYRLPTPSSRFPPLAEIASSLRPIWMDESGRKVRVPHGAKSAGTACGASLTAVSFFSGFLLGGGGVGPERETPRGEPGLLGLEPPAHGVVGLSGHKTESRGASLSREGGKSREGRRLAHGREVELGFDEPRLEDENPPLHPFRAPLRFRRECMGARPIAGERIDT